MPEYPPTFKTIQSPAGPFVLKEKKSKFLGWAFPVTSVGEAERRILELRTAHADASHVCYAYRVGTGEPRVRISDDGEPAHSAGSPIFGQIEAAGLHETLICVVRYYGGVKLGVGGLIQAYREAARGVLQTSQVVTRVPKCMLLLDFEYDRLDAVMRLISKYRLQIRKQQMDLRCEIELEVTLETSEAMLEAVRSLERVHVRKRTMY